MNLHAAELLPQIQAALTGVSPLRQLTDAEQKTFDATLRKLSRLAESLREPPLPAEPERPDPLQAGAQIHELALQEIKGSNGALSYTDALTRVCMSNWPLVREWQQSVQAPRRRR
jgi:hypothetical protein